MDVWVTERIRWLNAQQLAASRHSREQPRKLADSGAPVFEDQNNG